jgi:four helix bundle protein
MPSEERFGLMNQMRRAAVSVPSNIAEGYCRQGRMDYVRFLKTARGSLAELCTQYELATSMGMITAQSSVTNLLDETERVLQSLITSLERKAP